MLSGLVLGSSYVLDRGEDCRIAASLLPRLCANVDAPYPFEVIEEVVLAGPKGSELKEALE